MGGGGSDFCEKTAGVSVAGFENFNRNDVIYLVGGIVLYVLLFWDCMVLIGVPLNAQTEPSRSDRIKLLVNVMTLPGREAVVASTFCGRLAFRRSHFANY